MKVKRLVEEVGREKLETYKKQLKDAETNQEAWDIIKKFLSECEIPEQILNSMQQTFGLSFIESWLTSMKWEEAALGRKNEFINLLNYLEPINAPLTDKKNFTKLYNAYVKNLLDDLPLDATELGSGESIALLLLINQSLYSLSDEDYFELLRIFRKQLDKVEKGELNTDALRSLFFENGNIKGQVRTIQSIKNELSRSGEDVRDITQQNRYSNLSDQEARTALETILNRNGMPEIAQQIINNLRNETGNLQQA